MPIVAVPSTSRSPSTYRSSSPLASFGVPVSPILVYPAAFIVSAPLLVMSFPFTARSPVVVMLPLTLRASFTVSVPSSLSSIVFACIVPAFCML